MLKLVNKIQWSNILSPMRYSSLVNLQNFSKAKQLGKLKDGNHEKTHHKNQNRWKNNTLALAAVIATGLLLKDNIHMKVQ